MYKGQVIGVKELKTAVDELGGYDHVCKNRLWSQVQEELNLSSNGGLKHNVYEAMRRAWKCYFPVDVDDVAEAAMIARESNPIYDVDLEGEGLIAGQRNGPKLAPMESGQNLITYRKQKNRQLAYHYGHGIRCCNVCNHVKDSDKFRNDRPNGRKVKVF